MSTWPAVTIEVGFGLLPQVATTWPLVMGDTSTFHRDVGLWAAGVNATIGLAPGTAPPGSRNSLGVTSSGGNTQTFVFSASGSVVPSTSYTFTGQIRAATTARTCIVAVTWYTSSGSIISTPTASVADSTSTWTTITLVSTSPSNADHVAISYTWNGCAIGEVHFLGLMTADTTVSQWTNITPYVRQLDLQRSQRTYELDRFECGTATVTIDNRDGRFDPSNGSGVYAPYVVPITPIRVRATWSGARYDLWTGLVERWPLSWSDPGLSEPQITATEWMSSLAQNILRSTYEEEVLLDNPVAFYPCIEANTSTAVGNIVGTDVARRISGRQGGAGTELGGSAIVYDGSSSISLNPGASPPFADVYDFSASPGIIPSTATGWTFEIWALQGSATPVVPSPLFTQLDAYSARAGFEIVISRTFLGQISLWVGSTVVFDSPAVYFGSGPVYMAITLSTAGVVSFYVDGATPVYTGSPTLGVTPRATVVGGDWYAYTSPKFSFSGYAGMIAVYDYELLSDRVAAHYDVGTSGGDIENTGNRMGRILNYAGWPLGPRSIQEGLSTAGSAGGFGLSGLGGNSALDALQTDSDAEGGQTYAAADGTVVFESRTYRQSQTNPTWTFDPTGGLPYQLDSVAFDFDDTYIYNTIQLTRDGGPTQARTDTGSEAQFLPRTYTQTLNVAYDDDVIGRINMLLFNYRYPSFRMPSLTFTPSGNPSALFPVALGVDISDYVLMNHRPIGAAPITYAGYVDGISHSITVEPGSQAWTTSLLMSPTWAQLWQMAALRTTVAANASSGATTLTLNGLADRATNPAAASMSAGAYPVVAGVGTTYQIIRAGALRGTVVVTAVSTTSPGYATFTVTVNATGFAISTGDILCSPLPPGIVDPAVYDSRSTLTSVTPVLGG